MVRLNQQGQPFCAQDPSGDAGLAPQDIQSAYRIPDAGALPSGPPPRIAIVVEGDNPNALADMEHYRSTFGLQPCGACLEKVNAAGNESPLPSPDTNGSWTLEIANDLDGASTVCPACLLLLVEADLDSVDGGLTKYQAIETAARMGATVISNSWIDPEAADASPSVEPSLDHPGIGVFFAGADMGYFGGGNANADFPFPASSPLVWAVGGTTLVKNPLSARGWTETVWSTSAGAATGSVCNGAEQKPSWQPKAIPCLGRATNDVAANGDSHSGLWVYNTYAPNSGCCGWSVAGGTSLSAVLVASMFALTGHGDAGPDYAYRHTGDFFDIDSGSNGDCDGGVMCTAGPGWNGPTGNGTPNVPALVSPAVGSNTSSTVAPKVERPTVPNESKETSMDSSSVFQSLAVLATWWVVLIAFGIGAFGGLAHYLGGTAPATPAAKFTWLREMLVGGVAAVAILFVVHPATGVTLVSSSLIAGYAGRAIMSALEDKAKAVIAQQAAVDAVKRANDATQDIRTLIDASDKAAAIPGPTAEQRPAASPLDTVMADMKRKYQIS